MVRHMEVLLARTSGVGDNIKGWRVTLLITEDREKSALEIHRIGWPSLCMHRGPIIQLELIQHCVLDLEPI